QKRLPVVRRHLFERAGRRILRRRLKRGCGGLRPAERGQHSFEQIQSPTHLSLYCAPGILNSEARKDAAQHQVHFPFFEGGPGAPPPPPSTHSRGPAEPFLKNPPPFQTADEGPLD